MWGHMSIISTSASGGVVTTVIGLPKLCMYKAYKFSLLKRVVWFGLWTISSHKNKFLNQNQLGLQDPLEDQVLILRLGCDTIET